MRRRRRDTKPHGSLTNRQPANWRQDGLGQIKEVALVYPGRAREPQISYTRLTPLQRQLVAALKLDRFQQP